MTFANAVTNQEARTDNGMKARKGTGNALVDMFFKAGAMRGQDITQLFTAALVEDKELALRITMWLRDVREGAGERQHFRNILKYLEVTDLLACIQLMNKTPELGRWDDLLVLETPMGKDHANHMIAYGLNELKSQLCAKWMPRKGGRAEELRKFMNLSPKQYRKLLVSLTNVVETQMCAKDWDGINFSHVPSKAMATYRKAFERNSSTFADYAAELAKPVNERDPKVKINAGAIYPHDVIKSLFNFHWGDATPKEMTVAEFNAIVAQWDALPNFIGDASILPIVDVSGSMDCLAGGSTSVTCSEVALALGLYCADKNKGVFKDVTATFSTVPQLDVLKGNIQQKVMQLSRQKWSMSTNLHAVFDLVLKTAQNGNVAKGDMPNTLLILSDMQFNQCVRFDDTALEMIKRKYEQAGYEMPNVVFWNLNAGDNVPVRCDENGTALVSGFSPSILEAVLKQDTKEFTPFGIMMGTIMKQRYDMV